MLRRLERIEDFCWECCGDGCEDCDWGWEACDWDCEDCDWDCDDCEGGLSVKSTTLIGCGLSRTVITSLDSDINVVLSLVVLEVIGEMEGVEVTVALRTLFASGVAAGVVAVIISIVVVAVVIVSIFVVEEGVVSEGTVVGVIDVFPDFRRQSAIFSSSAWISSKLGLVSGGIPQQRLINWFISGHPLDFFLGSGGSI